jgi:hypothetical protein
MPSSSAPSTAAIASRTCFVFMALLRHPSCSFLRTAASTLRASASSVPRLSKAVKKKFIDEPGQMKLLIVVDKLLTGFDASPATYLSAATPSTSRCTSRRCAT